MGSTPNSPRRIVPPSMPTTQGIAPPPVAYTPPKYSDPSSGSGTKLLVMGGLLVVMVVAAALAFKTWTTPRDQAVLAAIEERAAELQGAQQERAKDATAAGWVGVLDLPIERATISVNTVPDGGRTASDWNANLGEQVSLAILSIDNTNGSEEISVDTSGAMVQLADGSSKEAIDTMKVLQSAKTGRDQMLKELSSPLKCRVGQTVLGKILFLPRGTDANAIKSIMLNVNGQRREITGSFMSETQKAEAMKSQSMRAGGTTAQGAP